ncbi:MAG TPA: response regulator [Terriglobales bacterium]|nr:response regulator [Terriglobales bacterium]
MQKSQNPNTILIVDDNEVHRYALSRLLQSRNYGVLIAANGSQALEAVKQSPSMVLMDIHLPDTTGYKVLEELRSRPETASLPVILMSATEPAPQARNTAASLGVQSFLTLPVSPDDLWIVIEATLRRQQRRTT